MLYHYKNISAEESGNYKVNCIKIIYVGTHIYSEVSVCLTFFISRTYRFVVNLEKINCGNVPSVADTIIYTQLNHFLLM